MKREWQFKSAIYTKEGLDIFNPQENALWAIVERLEALVGALDDIGEVYDVIANHLTFGGQPVGDMTPHPANWQCQKTKECSLFNGHQGGCIRPHDYAVTTDLCPVAHPATGKKCMLLAGHDSIHAFPEPGESDDGPDLGELPGGPGAPPHGGYPDSEPVVVDGVKFEPVIPARTCQCIKPQFDTGNVCGRCGFPKEWQGFYAK